MPLIDWCDACDGEGNCADGSACQGCCDHSDKDGFQCMICGFDCTEDMVSDAYDRAKAARYDD